MWAQLIKMRVREGEIDRFLEVNRQWEEQVGRGTDSGWERSIYLQSTGAPREWYEIAYFESEEKARANEQTPQHLELLRQLAELIEGHPEYADLTPVEETRR
jgi:quinol monooxygenase YgiN